MKNFNSRLMFIRQNLNKKHIAKSHFNQDLSRRIAALLLALTMLISSCKTAVITPEDSASAKTAATSETPVQTQLAEGDEFTIAVLPDTQYYTDPNDPNHGGAESMFQSQIDWIKANRVAENIVYVAHMGDITDDGDNDAAQWTRATNCLYDLETPTADLPYGIPYGLAVGNHDQAPLWGNPGASLARFNQYFGRNHFAGRSYYGGNYAGSGSNNNDHHFDLFTAGGVDFIVVYLEFDGNDVSWNTYNQWAQDLLATYSSRKAIIITHNLMNAGVGTAFNPQGAAIYNKVKYRTNTFLMLSGHTGPQGRRADTYNNNTINTVMQDYQSNNPSGSGAAANGGNGWLRLFKFSIANNQISVRTYSPVVNQWSTNSNNEFTLQMFSTPVAPPSILIPSEDAFGRDGTYTGTNYGSSTTLDVKSAPSVNFSRRAYLKFDLSSISTVSKAKLRVFGKNIESTAGVGINVQSAGDNWTEAGVNWGNAPSGSYIGTVTVNSTAKYYEWDVTTFVQSQNSGDKVASFVMYQAASANLTTNWNSKDNAVNTPQLVINP